ncbi:MAG: vitamin K epoxide reductase family protein [Candidatus Komeilibacteria bacterium]|nr:vitamin K epoxide reductase family protein [Candidatus Komeilibacteria bacterium]
MDAIYLTTSHYTGHITCSVISGCQEVLVSQYSEIFGIPLALLGAAYYLFILINSLLYIDNQNKYSKLVLSYIPIFGFLFSIYLIYLMFFVIEALCQYCLLSAGTSTLLFILGIILIKKK